MKKIVIVGAGPGGLVAAIKARKKGFQATILEKNPDIRRNKVCAGGISLTDFEKYNFPEYLRGMIREAVVNTFGDYKIKTPSQEAVIGSDGNTAATLDRVKLNMVLAKEAERLGAKIIFKERVTQIEDNFVVTESGHKYEFDHLIGADGSNSAVRKILGLGKESVILAMQYMLPYKYPKIVFCINKKRFRISYGWIFPQNGKTSVGTGKYLHTPGGLSTQQLEANLRDWIKEEFATEELSVKEIEALLQELIIEAFPILVDYQGHMFRNGKVYLVGDAAGFANELTGGGIISAIVSAMYVIEKIANPDYQGQELERILRSKKNSRKLLQLMSYPLIGRILAETFVLLLKFSFFRTRMGRMLM
jgi:flavin-dependent dehydrogenase